MAEFDSEEKGYQLNHTYQLHVETKYENQLDVEGFSLMMKNPSYCYKFYWRGDKGWPGAGGSVFAGD